MRDLSKRDVTRVGLLLCDHAPAPLRHIAGDYDEMFRALLALSDARAEMKIYDVTAGEYPEDPADCDGYLISGSSASVYNDAAWIAALESYVLGLHDLKIPIVGVCFGHQLVARALGGEVAKTDRGWGIGVRTVPLIEEYWWMRPRRDTVSLVVSHQDQVLSLPEGATTCLGGDDHCPIAFFIVDDHILCMQGHPEYPPAYGRALADRRAGLIPQTIRDIAEPTFDRPTDSQILARWIINFITREGR